ncbi:uncharacterized protein B4U80_12580, partial [Leptotrombidium deliense]
NNSAQSQVVLPIRGRKLVIQETHNAGHFGKFKTYKLISLQYWWPEMREDISYCIRRCETCSRKKARYGAGSGKYMPLAPQIPLPIYGVFSLVAFDIIVFDSSLQTQRKNKYILVAIDYLSHFAVAKATTNQEARTVQHFLFNDVFLVHGFPIGIITDQGSNICAKEVEEAFLGANIIHHKTTPYHPSSNGLVEKLNGIIKSILTSHVNANRKNWDTL